MLMKKGREHAHTHYTEKDAGFVTGKELALKVNTDITK